MSILNNLKYLPKSINWKSTKDDFYTLCQDNQKAELIHGIITIHSPVSLTHATLRDFIMSLIRTYVEEKELGIVTGEKVAIELSDEIVYEPDIIFVSNKNLKKVKHTNIVGAPDLVVEIVSPATAENDYVLKKQDYEKFGVSEYWIINPYKKEAFFYVLKNKKYKRIALKNNIFYSNILPGFYINTNWLWKGMQNFPKISTIISKMIS